MRFFNKDNELKVYALTGTQTVLLAMDLPKTKSVGKKFMGFKISRQIGNYTTVLNGTKRFASDDPNHPIQPLSPLQTFLWKDYTVDPNRTYKYKFEAMFGSWDNMSPKYEAELTVKTEPLVSGEHSVFFNFGVTGSQAYAKKFEKKKVESLPKADKEKAFDILGRELFKDGLLKFVKQAKNSRFKLLSAFYELEYQPFLNALKDAQNKGAEIQLVYSARPTQKAINEAEIKKAGLEDVSIGRSYQVAQPHNKFMLLLEDGKPTQVWTGSTNITIRAIFGHSNTGHWIKNEAIAKKYHDYWKLLSTNPKKSDLNTLTEKLQNDINGSRLYKGTKVIFSPRKTDDMLAEYVKIMDKAKDAVCIIYPFNIEKIFKDFYSDKRDFIRFIITDKGGDKNNIITDDRNVVKTQGAILDTAVENWVKEMTAKATTGAGTLYVHNKFFLVDPLGDSPVVVSGSANFSDESLTKNDENMLIVKGDKRTADIYFTEFSRMFDHFMPRYLKKLADQNLNNRYSYEGFSKPLDESGQWCDTYFEKDRLVYKRKQMFKKMKGAVKG
mgnify:CR=1 FL=1